MMKFTINETIFGSFPGLKMALLIAKNIDNTTYPEELEKEMRQIEQDCIRRLNLESLTQNPKIKDWRNAYIKFGAKPKTYKNSVESLLRRILKQDNNSQLPKINKIVDLYNIVSVKYLLPVGGDDLGKIEGNIALTFADGTESFTLLGGKESSMPEKGEVIYKDDKEVLCRRWNWRECDKTKMTKETKDVCLIIESLSSTSREELLLAINELKEKVELFCNAETKIFILDKDNREITI